MGASLNLMMTAGHSRKPMDVKSLGGDIKVGQRVLS